MAQPMLPAYPEKAKAPVTVESIEGNTWLLDNRGKRWLLRQSSLGNPYWQKINTKSSGGYSVYMRTPDETTSMQQLAEQKMEIEAIEEDLSYGVFAPSAPILANAVPNPQKRQQQGQQMAKYFGADAVKLTNGDNNGSYISASTYAGEIEWEWLHMQGHSLGGLETPDNLVAGSHGANTEMAAIEAAVGKFMGAKAIQIEVTPALEIGTRLGKPSVKAVAIRYQVTVNGTPVIDRNINARREKMPKWEYDQLESRATYMIQNETTDYPVVFVKSTIN